MLIIVKFSNYRPRDPNYKGNGDKKAHQFKREKQAKTKKTKKKKKRDIRSLNKWEQLFQ
mgnify:CR=1 FL=1